MLLRMLREGRGQVILVDCLRRKRRAVVKDPCYRRAGCRQAGRRESRPLAWQPLVQQSDLGRCRIAQEQQSVGGPRDTCFSRQFCPDLFAGGRLEPCRCLVRLGSRLDCTFP